MDKFIELPLPQRLLALALVLAIIGGGGYFGLIQPTFDDIESNKGQLRHYMMEYNKLRQFDSDEFKKEIAREKKELEEKKRNYQRLLPTKEDLPEFIESLKQDADTAGLDLIEFKKLAKNIPGPQYIKIPIQIKLRGHFSQLLAFLDALAAPTKRLVNIGDFSIKAYMPPLNEVEKELGDIGLLRILKEKAAVRKLLPSEIQAKEIILYEEASKRTILDVSMTAYVFMYTGK